MGWNRALQKNNFSSSEKLFFFAHAWTASNRTWNIVYPITWWKDPRWESSLRPSRLKSDTLPVTLQEPCFEGILPLSLSICFSCKGLGLAWFTEKKGCAKKTTFQALKSCFLHTNLVKLRQARLCKKTTFQALKKCFLHTNLMKIRQARLCKKNNCSGSKIIIFLHASCQICQLHLVTSFKLAPNYADACTTKLRMP